MASDHTVIAAFRAALLHQGIVVLGGADGPGRPHDGPQLSQDRLLQGLLGHLEEGLSGGLADAGCVEDQHVGWAQRRGDLGGEPVHVVRVGDIGLDGHAAAAAPLDVSHYRRGGGRVVVVVHRHSGTQGGQQPGRGRPNPVAGTGDKGNPPGEQPRIHGHGPHPGVGA
jgi:hypothetical protein